MLSVMDVDRISLGDTVQVKDGPPRYREGIVIGCHGNDVRVEFGDGRCISADRPGRLVVPIVGGVALAKGSSVKQAGAKRAEESVVQDLWPVSKRPDGRDW